MRRLFALLVLAASCSDPVRDQRIAELGDETATGPGPDHRPGQDCLLCHSPGGPASDTPFAAAGTVYTTPTGDDGASGIEVRFIDAAGRGPVDKVVTTKSGNFYVPAGSWKVTFPFRVGLYKGKDELVAPMISTVNREASCNYCHRNDDVPSSLSKEERTRRFYGQIYAGAPQ